jgi:hypothetical protein
MRTVLLLIPLLLFIRGGSQCAATTLTFDDLPNEALLTNQLPGILVEGAAVLQARISLNELEFPPLSGDRVLAQTEGPVVFQFQAPIKSFRAHFTYLSPITVSAYNKDGSLLSRVTSRHWTNSALSGGPGSLPNEQLDISSDTGIHRIELNTPLGKYSFALDNLTYQALHDVSPQPEIVLPAGGMGESQDFTFRFSSPLGYQALGVQNVLIHFGLDGVRSCYLAFSQPDNVLYLVHDSGDSLSHGISPGSTEVIGNSQCSIPAEHLKVSRTGKILEFTLRINFHATYAGSKVVHLASRDQSGNNSGWHTMGVWEIPGSAPANPSVIGIQPQHGSGASASFTMSFSDISGADNLGVLNLLIQTGLDGRNACYLAYSHPLGFVYLVNDDGAELLQGGAIGYPAALQNSQCAVDLGKATVTQSGTVLTLTFEITFKKSFGGNRVLYLAARGKDAGNSGWQPLGTWNAKPGE